MNPNNIAPFFSGQRVIARRHPLFPPVTVKSVREIAPGVWRFDWEYKPSTEAAPVTGSAAASGYVRAGG